MKLSLFGMKLIADYNGSGESGVNWRGRLFCADVLFNRYRDVTRKVFEGCIKEVQVGRDAMAMVTTNLYAKGVMPGCPEVNSHTRTQ